MKLEEILLDQFWIRLAVVGDWNDEFVTAVVGGADVIDDFLKDAAIVVRRLAELLLPQIVELRGSTGEHVVGHPITDVRIGPTTEFQRVFIR